MTQFESQHGIDLLIERLATERHNNHPATPQLQQATSKCLVLADVLKMALRSELPRRARIAIDHKPTARKRPQIDAITSGALKPQGREKRIL